MSAGRQLPRWPLFVLAAPAAVAIWSGWVGLGQMCGFGLVTPLPGILPGFHLNTAITLPVGVEAYGAYALGAWLAPGAAEVARKFARRSALGSLLLGMAGQVIYHLLAAAHAQRAPWPVVVLVSCLPVITLGFGAGLTHLLRASDTGTEPQPAADTEPDRPADTAMDTTPVIRPARPRTSGRTGTAAAVARLRARHPDMPAADIARRLGVSDRTVRRHLANQPAPAAPSAAAA